MPKKTEQEWISKLEPVFAEIATLEEDIKAIKEDIKEDGFDATLLGTVAKAKVQGKLAKLEEKYKNTLDLLDSLN